MNLQSPKKDAIMKLTKLAEIRNEPILELMTIPMKGNGYKYLVLDVMTTFWLIKTREKSLGRM